MTDPIDQGRPGDVGPLRYVGPLMGPKQELDLTPEIDDHLTMIGFWNLEEQLDTYFVYEGDNRNDWGRILTILGAYTRTPMSTVGNYVFRVSLLLCETFEWVSTYAVVLDGEDVTGAHEIVVIQQIGDRPVEIISTRRVLPVVAQLLSLR